MSRPLTAELIRAKTKSDNLVHVRKFTLCANDIDDVRLLRQMPNLEILSLSVNKIESLKEFANCGRLEELYVRNNKISDLSELRFLKNLRNLRVLWLSENPCADHQYYREYIINTLPQLQNIDNKNITQEERTTAARLVSGENEQPDEQEESVSHREQGNYGQRYEENDGQRYDQVNGDDYNNEQDPDSVPAGYGNTYGHQQHQQQYQQQNQGDVQRRNNNVVRHSPSRVNRRSAGGARDINNTQGSRNDNILLAMITLMKDLDVPDLKILKREIETRINAEQEISKDIFTVFQGVLIQTFGCI